MNCQVLSVVLLTSITLPLGADGTLCGAMDYLYESIVVSGEGRLRSLALVASSPTLYRLMIAVTHSGRQQRSRPPLTL